MLIRIKINGFKNLLDTEAFFGPFTCIAGVNGVGKSNLFDAIRFLSMLSGGSTLLKAATSVRNESGKDSDYRQIFSHYGDEFSIDIKFEADMIIPSEATDDLGQKATASNTFIRYKLHIRKRAEPQHPSGPIEVMSEELRALRKFEFNKTVLFPNSKSWKDSVLQGKPKPTALISTDFTTKSIKLHQDQKKGGKAQPFFAPDLPRTVLSTTNALESPTALCVRKEMESWILLQLEPSALRKTSSFTDPKQLSPNGENLPAVIFRLGENLYQEIANSLSELIDDVRGIRIDKNEKRELFELLVETVGGTEYPAQALSDGTLRFLALAVLGIDPYFTGLVCMEEPENGIHPERLTAMVELVKDISVDCNEPVDESNPLRQVIVNTHSPSLVAQVPEETLVMAQHDQKIDSGTRRACVVFSGLKGTWREKKIPHAVCVSIGRLLSYLNPVDSPEKREASEKKTITYSNDGNRVVDWLQCEQVSMIPILCEDKVEYDKKN